MDYNSVLTLLKAGYTKADIEKMESGIPQGQAQTTSPPVTTQTLATSPALATTPAISPAQATSPVLASAQVPLLSPMGVPPMQSPWGMGYTVSPWGYVPPMQPTMVPTPMSGGSVPAGGAQSVQAQNTTTYTQPTPHSATDILASIINPPDIVNNTNL